MELLKLPEVMKRTTLSRATIYKWMAQGKFPKSVKLGTRAVAWRSEDIDKWLEDLKEGLEKEETMSEASEDFLVRVKQSHSSVYEFVREEDWQEGYGREMRELSFVGEEEDATPFNWDRAVYAVGELFGRDILEMPDGGEDLIIRIKSLGGK